MQQILDTKNMSGFCSTKNTMTMSPTVTQGDISTTMSLGKPEVIENQIHARLCNLKIQSSQLIVTLYNVKTPEAHKSVRNLTKFADDLNPGVETLESYEGLTHTD